MPTEIFEDTLDLSIGLLETEPVAPGPSYPFPRLRPNGLTATRSFRTIIIENPFLRITIVPALGGRILRLYDKRTAREILPAADGKPPAITPAPGGRRGALVRDGIQLRLDGEDRLNSLGPVAYQLEQPEDDEAPGGVWLAESAMANGLGFHLHVSLPPDRAQVRFEARIQNRTFQPLPYDGEIAAFFGPGAWDGVAVYDDRRDVGLALFSDELSGDARWEEGALRFSRFAGLTELAPRQVDTWSATLTPISGLGLLSSCSQEAAGSLRAERLRIQSASRRPGHKLVLLTEAGETLEAPADLYAEHVFEMSLAGLPSPPRAIALLDPTRNEILRLEPSPSESLRGHPIHTQTNSRILLKPHPSPPREGSVSLRTGGEGNPESVEVLSLTATGPFRSSQAVRWPTLADRVDSLRCAAFDVATRYVALTQLGILAMRSAAFMEADAWFEKALLYNADDPLLWWEKALASRLAGDPASEDERPELLNAHFLASLEPALKAEAVLTQAASGVDGPNPLLAPMAEVPEEYVEVACLLIERGRLDLAARWISDALPHADVAMLHILLAYCLLVGARMDADAADHLAKATQLPGPPYPWRDIERTALEHIQVRFPANTQVAALLQLMSAPSAAR